MIFNKSENISQTEPNIITTDIQNKEKVFSLTLFCNGQTIEAEKKLMIEDSDHNKESFFLIKIIDALLSSTLPTFENNGCFLDNNPYENLRTMFYLLPILEMSSAFLTQKVDEEDIEFSYNIYQCTVNSSKAIIVESTFEQDEISAPTALFLTLSFFKKVFNLTTKESIDKFIDYLQER